MNSICSINVDRNIYNDAIITKAIYWHTENFIIDRIFNGDTETITFKSKNETEINPEKIIEKFNQDLNDYKLRQVIEEETKDIRTILYVKAFANNNEFEEYE